MRFSTLMRERAGYLLFMGLGWGFSMEGFDALTGDDRFVVWHALVSGALFGTLLGLWQVGEWAHRRRHPADQQEPQQPGLP